MKNIQIFLLSLLFLAKSVFGISDPASSAISDGFFSKNIDTYSKEKQQDSNDKDKKLQKYKKKKFDIFDESFPGNIHHYNKKKEKKRNDKDEKSDKKDEKKIPDYRDNKTNNKEAFHVKVSIESITPKNEYEIIQSLLRSFYQNDTIKDDPIVQCYLENIINKLMQGDEFKDKTMTVLLIQNPTLNAFSSLGDIIGVNTGLIYHLNSEEELAAVLSHELVHIGQKHIYRMLVEQKRMVLPTIVGALAGTLLTKNDSDIGVAAAVSSIGAFASHTLSFNRQSEEEADRIGIRLMNSAGINPQGMPKFFKRMKRFESQNQPLELFRTHPLTSNRVSDADSFASQYPDKGYPKSSVDFDLVKIHILFDYLPLMENPVTYLQGYIKKNVLCSEAAHYGMAMAYYRGNQYKKAAEQLTSLLKEAPNNLIYQLLKNKIMYSSGEQQKALKDMKQLVDDNPDYFPASMIYAKLLNQSSFYKESQAVLQQLLNKQPLHPFVWKLMIDTSAKTNDHAEYYIANARYLQLTGDAEGAIKRLEYVLNNERIEYSKKLSMQQLLNTLQQEQNQ